MYAKYQSGLEIRVDAGFCLGPSDDLATNGMVREKPGCNEFGLVFDTMNFISCTVPSDNASSDHRPYLCLKPFQIRGINRHTIKSWTSLCHVDNDPQGWDSCGPACDSEMIPTNPRQANRESVRAV
jgi:hypothetical protein